jgi:hypothetical protein
MANPSAAPMEVAAPSEPPVWAVPDGWRKETIPFPLEFAPGLAYRGVEELRFPPGFFKAGDAQYWTYAFVWYIASPGPVSVEALEADLVAYFGGLARAVGGADRKDIAAFEFRAVLEGDLAREVTGTADAFDAFEGEQPVHLHLRITPVPCARPGETLLLFRASPRAPAADDPQWQALDALAATVRCEPQPSAPAPASP